MGGVYVEIFRNIPLLVLLVISYAGLRRAGVDNQRLGGGDGLAGPVHRRLCRRGAALGRVPVGKGQIEASLSLGFSYAATLRRIVLPQAFRTVISPLGSLTIAMIKNSVIVGVSLLALSNTLNQ